MKKQFLFVILASLNIFLFFNICEYKNEEYIARFQPTLQEIINDGIYGPNVPIYCYSDTIIEDELNGVQVPVPRSDRVFNTKGNCVWCSLELCGRYAEMQKLYNITKNPGDGGDARCQGGSSPGPVRRFLEEEKIKYEMITNGDRNFLLKCKNEGRPIAFGIPGHMLNLIHYDPDTKVIKIIDNADSSLSVQQWSWEKFHQLWTGWAYVIYPDDPSNDIAACKSFGYARMIPIIDRNNSQGKYDKDYIPLPFNQSH